MFGHSKPPQSFPAPPGLLLAGLWAVLRAGLREALSAGLRAVLCAGLRAAGLLPPPPPPSRDRGGRKVPFAEPPRIPKDMQYTRAPRVEVAALRQHQKAREWRRNTARPSCRDSPAAGFQMPQLRGFEAHTWTSPGGPPPKAVRWSFSLAWQRAVAGADDALQTYRMEQQVYAGTSNFCLRGCLER